jgi:hypothetical protein
MPELVGTGSIADGVSGRRAIKYSETDAITAAVAYVNGLKAAYVPTHHAETITFEGKASSLTVAVGGKLYFDLEGLRYLACEAFRNCALAPATPYLAVNAGLRLNVNSPSDEPLWRLDGVGQVSVGLQSAILGVDASAGTALGPWPLTAPPGEPTNVQAQAGNESATISWHAPEKNPASPLGGEPPCACKEVSNYTVFINGEEHETTATQITIPNLTNGKTYTVTVRANANPGKPFDSRETKPITVTPVGIKITPAKLPLATEGKPYSAALSAKGGEAPYAWAVTNGTPPQGLGLGPSTGVISGTSSAVGTSDFEVTATDKNGAKGTAQYSLTVGATGAYPVSFTASVNIPKYLPGSGAFEGFEGTVTGVEEEDCNSTSYTRSFCAYEYTGVTGTLYGGELTGTSLPYVYTPCSASVQEFLEPGDSLELGEQLLGGVLLGKPPGGNAGIALGTGDSALRVNRTKCRASVDVGSFGDSWYALNYYSSPWAPGSQTSSWLVYWQGGEPLVGSVTINWQY